MDLDFGYNGGAGSADTTPQNGNDIDAATNLNTGKVDHSITSSTTEDIEDVNGAETTTTDNAKQYGKDGGDKEQTRELVAGTAIEVGDAIYTVDDNGNVLDANGNVFKEASQVQEWLKEFDDVDERVGDEFSIDSIQQALGVTIVDENDAPIEFDNSVEGIQSYVAAVIDTAREEHYETALNTFFQKYPIIEDVLDYYVANGNSLEGFGDVPDRSGIEIAEDNVEQQEAIIRAAWREQGRKGDVNGYIEYLKSSGTLYATAQDELDGMQEADAKYREELAEEAARVEEEQAQAMRDYWNGVYEIINSRTIAGYQIPESIIVNRGGQKISVTPNDFFNYLYRVDGEGKSAYRRDLEAETAESRRDDELLRAYLKFVGGTYSNLVDMAVNKEKVSKLRLIAKENNRKGVVIKKPTNSANKGTNVDLGYN